MMTKNTSLRRCIEDLSSKNTDYKYPEQAINQAESLKSLSSDLYTDDVRFIYELIQNADDAQTIHIILAILDNKYLIIGHDGLGFKAVFGKSDYVIIYSNDEFFRFDSSCPIKWNKQWGTDDQQAWERENDRQFIYSWQINPIWTTANEIPNPIVDEHGRVTRGSSIENIHVQDSILFSYLPTTILEYKFPVLINTNFLTNTNREQIHIGKILMN
ncbi:unnamed protein product [Rotaria sp. Silwood2]|nr:unnamed protein product [Rotaria sp. Silwood2]